VLAFVAEEWMARRVHSRWFPETLPLSTAERSALYYVMSHHAGVTLEAMLDAGRHFPVADSVSLGMQLAKGIGALHRLNILHRDIKPANLLLCDDGALRILDLGVALNLGAIHTVNETTNPGTPSYMAPELFDAAEASFATDLYALGVTLYRLLTRRYPYGEVEPFQHPHFGDPAPPTRYRQDIPAWLEAVLLKAVARDPARRFETAEELLLALERGPQSDLSVPRRTPLAERDPVRMWAGIALTSILVNLILAWILMR
jgi:protein phosphatase